MDSDDDPAVADLVYVADRDEFEGTNRIIADVQGREIAVFNLGDEWRALSNYCTHQGGPVCEGMVSGSLTVNDEQELDYSYEDQLVSCPWHGWEFDIETGEHLARPKYRLPRYDVVVREGRVYIDP